MECPHTHAQTGVQQVNARSRAEPNLIALDHTCAYTQASKHERRVTCARLRLLLLLLWPDDVTVAVAALIAQLSAVLLRCVRMACMFGLCCAMMMMLMIATMMMSTDGSVVCEK